MEKEDQAKDPRKAYSLNKSNCKDLTYLQKIHRPDCIAEATQQTIIRPKPHPSPKPPPVPPARPPAERFEIPGEIPFRFPRTDTSAEQIAATLGLSADLASYAASLSQMIEPRDLRRVFRVGRAMAPRGAYRRALIAPEERFDPFAREFGDEVIRATGRAPAYMTTVSRRLSSGLGEAMQRAMSNNRALTMGGGYRPMEVVRATEPLPRVEIPEDIEMGELRAAPPIPEELQGLSEELTAEAAETAARPPPVPADIEMGNLRPPMAVPDIPTIAADAPAVAEGAEVAGRITTAGSEIASSSAGRVGTGVLRGILESTGGKIAGLGAGALGSSIATSTATTIASDVLGAAGLGLGIYSEISGIIKGTKAFNSAMDLAKGYGGVSGTHRLSASQITTTVNSLSKNTKEAEATLESMKKNNVDAPTIAAQTKKVDSLQKYTASIINAADSNQPIIAYTGPDHEVSGLGIQLTKPELATAIKNYQTDPDIFKGVPTKQLEVMGLNPSMTQGKAGAVKTPSGNYVPKTLATLGNNLQDNTKAPLDSRAESVINQVKSGKLKTTLDLKTYSDSIDNYTSFYLSQSLRNTTSQTGPFSSLQDIQNSYIPAKTFQGQADFDYATKAEKLIKEIADPKVKAYMQYKLDTFAYDNKLLPTPPGKAPPKPSDAELSATPQVGQIQGHASTNNNHQRALASLTGANVPKPNITPQDRTQLVSQINSHNLAVAKQGEAYASEYLTYNKQVAQATLTPIVGGFNAMTKAQTTNVNTFIQNNLQTIPKPTAPSPAPAAPSPAPKSAPAPAPKSAPRILTPAAAFT